MELALKEAPGGAGDCWQCPNCSRMYPQMNEGGERVQPPRQCTRCGSPMDIEASAKFGETQAEIAASATAPQARRTVKA